MYLKKIALKGFKTFAENTSLELGPGLTAIVGPNGSGKSNIVDAMLWALGERSHKSLRANAATDVIFNGSGDRKPQGMAEVSLFFDNEDKTLPLDFNEVQVTRRVFRDGETQYALNKTNCRLRDVVDLFLDTGVGPDAYSIVSQSEIDAILSARPEDRRHLLESAAGVQKYRARRTETRRKLERVQADLTRVDDITSELQRQLIPLAEQAETARQYDSFVARLKFLQLAMLAREYDLRVTRLESMRAAKDTGTETVLAGLATIEKQETGAQQLEARRVELERSMETAQAQTTDVITRLKATEGEIAVARERRRALTEQQEFLAQEIGLLRARITTARENLTAQKRELQNAVQSAGALSEGAADAEKSLGAANVNLQDATRALQDLQSRVIELMRQGQQRREKMATGRAEIVALENRRDELQQLAQTLENENAGFGSAQQKANDELSASQKHAAQLKDAAENALTKVTEAQNALSEIERASGILREERARRQSRLGALRELEQNLEGVQGGARAVMQAVGRGQISDDYTLVADAIRAPQQVETAIEIALGGAVNNLICARDAQAKTAIAWLKSNRAGRATFLPLEALRPSGAGTRTRDVLRENGVIGLASELVECDQEYQRAIEYLLGRVLVVENVDIATRLAPRCDMGSRLVTLEGELVLPSGAITGGQGKQKTSGLLARKRELDELESLIDEQSAQIESQKAAAEIARLQVLAVQDSLLEQQETANEVRAQIARQEREIEHLQRGQRKLKSDRDGVTHQLNNTLASLQAKTSRQNEDRGVADDADEKARALDEDVARARELVQLRQNERELIADSVSQVRADYSASQERLGGMRRAITEVERGIVEAETQIRSRQTGIERAGGEDARIVQQEAESVALLAQLQERREHLEARNTRERGERAQIVTAIENMGATLKNARVKLRDDEEELHRVEVRLAATEAEIADMIRRFNEEFDTTPESARAHKDDIEHKGAALQEIGELTQKIGALGQVNRGAIVQHEQVRERLEFLVAQRDDLQQARAELDAIIEDIDARTRAQFMTTFETVREHFDNLFKRVFDGGQTFLSLTQPDNLLETGVELRVQPPGKAQQDIALLSGGERALTALTFMLALLKTSPSPFVVLDEVDAPLDQSNVGRFTQLLREFTDQTQFLVITHNNGTMQAADVLYGITMQKPGVSTIMSVRLVDDLYEPQRTQSAQRTAEEVSN